MDRHGLKSFTTVYSHGRSNIDYAIQLEQEEYKNLLNDEFLYHAKAGDTEVVRNNKYKTNANIFDPTHSNDFEFTHHDIIKDVRHRKSLERKSRRLNKYRGSKNFKFFYHYRLNNKLSMQSLFTKAEQFIKFYEKNGKNCEFIIFTQDIVDKRSLRGVECVKHSDMVKAYTFKTTDLWAGDDAGIFAAKYDDDLIVQMFN